MKAHTKPSAVIVTLPTAMTAITAAGSIVADYATKQADFMKALTKQLDAFTKAGGKLGKTARTCPYSKAVLDLFKSRGIKPATAANYLSAIRLYLAHPEKGFDLNPARTKAAKAAKAKNASGRMPAATSYTTTGEVLDALYKAIQIVQSKAGADLWVKALASSVDGLDDVLADFQQAQDPARPDDEEQADAAAKQATPSRKRRAA